MESCLFKVQIKAIAKILVATIIVQLFLTYTCGSQLKDLDLPEEFKNMEIWVHNCQDPIKKLYYSAKYEPIANVCIVQKMNHGQFPINILNVKNVVAYHQSRND